MAKILIVDDDPDFTAPVREWLTLHHHEVLSATGGAEAIRLAGAQKPDLILLDAEMPELSGVETGRRLRGDAQTRHIPIILITGGDPLADQLEKLMAGANDITTKPLVLERLGAQIELLLAGKSSSPEWIERLLNEAVREALAILPCDLAWLLTLDEQRESLVSRALATGGGERVAASFLEILSGDQTHPTIPLGPEFDLLTGVVTNGVATLNASLSELRAQEGDGLRRACEKLLLGFVSAFPLRAGGRPAGVLVLGSRDPLDLGMARDRQSLAVVVGQAERAIGQMHLAQRLAEHEAQSSERPGGRSLVLKQAAQVSGPPLTGEAQRRAHEVTLLLEASAAASSTLAIEQVAETTAWLLLEALAVQWCAICSWDNKRNGSLTYLVEVADLSHPAGQERRVALTDFTLTRQAIENGRPFAATMDDPELWGTRHDILQAPGVQAMLALPVDLDGRIVGVAELYHTGSRYFFSTDDLEHCQAVMQTWREALQAGSSWDDPGPVRQLGKQLLDTTGASWCTILRYRPQDDALSILHEQGKAVWPLGEGMTYQPDEDGPHLRALQRRVLTTARLDEATLVPGHLLDRQWTAGGSLLIVPLVARGEAVGLLQLMDRDADRTFSEDDLSLAQAMANVVGNALDNVHLSAGLLRRAAQLEAAYNDLQEANRLKDELIQNVSHEMRTPLTAIMGYAELMADGTLGSLNPQQLESVSVIAEKSHQLARLIEGILTFHELEQEPLQRSVVSLRRISEAAIRAIRSTARQSEVEIVTSYAENLPDTYADKTRLSQVFDHLLDNALKFSPEGGRITVTIWDTGHAIQTEITDQGIGIPTIEHEKIWQRFYQVDGSSTRVYGGTGMGLAIVRRIVEQHGGRVWVDSAPGKGSTFAFTIPKVDPTDTDAQ
jgi:signal transduction histidine kinase/CheY-like chemotaxis protein